MMGADTSREIPGRRCAGSLYVETLAAVLIVSLLFGGFALWWSKIVDRLAETRSLLSYAGEGLTIMAHLLPLSTAGVSGEGRPPSRVFVTPPSVDGAIGLSYRGEDAEIRRIPGLGTGLGLGPSNSRDSSGAFVISIPRPAGGRLDFIFPALDVDTL
jgi:hypothetical protein